MKRERKMAKIFLVAFAVFIAASVCAANFAEDPYLLQGSVYCDTCRCGYETDASKPITGAVVKVECRKRTNSEITYEKEGVTDSRGQYKILVERDCGDDYCDAMLVKSSDPECSSPNAGRDKARVILTRNNGMNSNTRFANPMGFLKNTPLATCSQILLKYQETEQDV